MEILLLAQNKLLRRAVTTYLARNQFLVHEAANREAAIDLVLQRDIAVVVCFWYSKWQMERDFVQQLRTLKLDRYLFILLLASRTNDEWLIEGMRVGADDYMISPLNLKHLRRRIILGERIQRLETRARQLLSEQTHQLYRDTLTGMWSRQALLERAAEVFAKLQQARRTIAILMLQINNLHLTNKLYGYQAGDKVIRTVAACITSSTREPDLIGRWSGSRMVVVISNANERIATTVADRVRSNIKQAHLVFNDSDPIDISVSIGISSSATTIGADLQMLLEQAYQVCRSAPQQDLERLP
jgi:two-component system, cell cycle response regulator